MKLQQKKTKHVVVKIIRFLKCQSLTYENFRSQLQKHAAEPLSDSGSPVVFLAEHLCPLPDPPTPPPHTHLHPLTLQPCFSPSSFVTKTKAPLSLSCWLPWKQSSAHPPLPLFSSHSQVGVPSGLGKRPTSAATVPFGAKLKVELLVQVLRTIPNDVRGEDSCSSVESGAQKRWRAKLKIRMSA